METAIVILANQVLVLQLRKLDLLAGKVKLLLISRRLLIDNQFVWLIAALVLHGDQFFGRLLEGCRALLADLDLALAVSVFFAPGVGSVAGQHSVGHITVKRWLFHFNLVGHINNIAVLVDHRELTVEHHTLTANTLA